MLASEPGSALAGCGYVTLRRLWLRHAVAVSAESKQRVLKRPSAGVGATARPRATPSLLWLLSKQGGATKPYVCLATRVSLCQSCPVFLCFLKLMLQQHLII